MIINPALVVGLACIFGALGAGGAWLVFARQPQSADSTEAAVAAAVAAMRAERAEYLQAALDATLSVASSKLGDQLAVGKHVIDRERLAVSDQVTLMSDELRRVSGLVTSLQQERAEQHGKLSIGLENAAAVTASLAATTNSLKEALASPKARGQWGERMAEDVLQLAGFVDGINYTKQTKLADGGIPDYSFVMPHGHQIHMDVKFPASNYLRWLETPDGADRTAVLQQFKRDVRTRVDELSTRGYANGADSVDYVLAFIPNESIYGFLHEHDRDLIDVALAKKVILCSPTSLFAVLAVIRQSVDNFLVERRSDELLAGLAGLQDQWRRFGETVDKVGRSLVTAQTAFDELNGPRRRALDKQLAVVDELRSADTPTSTVNDEMSRRRLDRVAP